MKAPSRGRAAAWVALVVFGALAPIPWTMVLLGILLVLSVVAWWLGRSTP